MRQDSPELAINFTGKNTELLQSMYDYTIVPCEKIKKRMDFFYTPYNQQFLLRKHMTFEDQLPDSAVDPNAPAAEKATPVQFSGLADIVEKMAEEKRQMMVAETAGSGANADILSTGDFDDDPAKVILRDRKFNKTELAQLEKKTWIEIKDLIFETEPSVLDYLSYHCKRWR